MLRLFVGLDLPAAVRQDLGRFEVPLTGAKWVDEDDLHLTLRFAGDINNHVADDFADELSRIEIPVFTMRISGTGSFGGADPHTLWAGIEAGAELDRLQQKIERAARNAGLAPESRKFKPHITLARLRGASPVELAAFLQRHGGYRSELITVEDFVLFSARPVTGGGPYGIEARYPMAGANPFAAIDQTWRSQ
jgi:RNA 2',3'-cyclic 3'-phosphodiesterase